MLYNTIYGGGSNHPSLGAGSPLEDPGRPGTFHESAFGSYRLNTAESLFPSWDNSIPSEDKSEWRDPQVAEAYASRIFEERCNQRRPDSRQLSCSQRCHGGYVLFRLGPATVGCFAHPGADAGASIGV
ncbi:hypothetical protein LJK87_26735 [Paenibacillus sp. P25]|nr:hypothetical protein LJK87_26735 [Paenibacillus sp. P25]